MIYYINYIMETINELKISFSEQMKQKEQLYNILAENLLSQEEIIDEEINKLENEQDKIKKVIDEKVDISMKLDTEIDELSIINEKLTKKLMKNLNSSNKEEFFKIEILTKNIFENNKKIDIILDKISDLDDEISDLENEIDNLEDKIDNLDELKNEIENIEI